MAVLFAKGYILMYYSLQKELCVFMDRTEVIFDKRIEKGKLGLKRLKEAAETGYEVNEKLLFKLLAENKNTEYGKKYDFEKINTVEEYKRKVPITEYSDYEKYIEKIEGGKKDVLSSRETIHFALSSGSSGNPKRVPMCQEAADLFALYTHGTCYAEADEYFGKEWKKGRGVSLTEVRFKTRENGFTYGAVSGKVREKNKEYETDVYTSPLWVSYPKEDMNFVYLHLRFSLAERNLSNITCTFMTAAYDAMRYFEDNWEMLAKDIAEGTIDKSIKIPDEIRKNLSEYIKPDKERSDEIISECKKGFEGIMPRVWKNLKFIFGIGSESFRIYTERMRYFLGDVKIHYSVFSASEGIFGCPIEMESDEMVLIPFSAFYEFRDAENTNADTITMDKVEVGKKYEIIVTNLSGFYRYRMMDVVEVCGFYGKIPKVRFLYRLNQVLNIAGEKTNDSTMKDVMGEFERKTSLKAKEYTVYADRNTSPGRYVVFAEFEKNILNEAEKMSIKIEEILCSLNSSYAEKIRLKKLNHLLLVPLKEGTYNEYVDIMKKKGVSVNQLKPVRVADSALKQEFFIEHMAENII